MIFAYKKMFQMFKFNRNVPSAILSSKQIDYLYAGTAAMQSMRALQTPLQEVTVGSAVKLRTHTWPT